MKGRKPKPPALRVVTTPPEKMKHLPAARAPRPKGELGKPPADLSPEAREVWQHVVTFCPPGMLSALDCYALEKYCVALSLHRDARRRVDEAGTVIESPVTRVPQQNPYLSIMNRQAEIAAKLGSELGLSPTARVRIGASLDSGKNGPVDDYDF